jgi:[protein-PII] uridylyltransferase
VSVISGTEARNRIIADRSITGRAMCRALSDATDRWLIDLFAAATAGTKGRFALVATGGYGRGELAPFSDLDVLLLHDSPKTVGEVAERLWYPIWDASKGADKIKLGHAVRTVKEAKQLASDDLDTATALLTCRHLAGDEALTADLLGVITADWRGRRSNWLAALAAGVVERARTSGEAAFLLEPNLKDSAGGLRDIHALRWAEAAGALLAPMDRATLLEAEDTLLDIRVALHRSTGRAGDILLLQEQDAVAPIAGFADADRLMASVSAAARRVVWIGEETWSRVDGLPPVAGDHALASGVVLKRGEVELDPAADPAADPTLVLRVARTAAASGARIGRTTLDRLAASTPEFPSPWPVGALDDLIGLLLTGHAAIRVFEALDQYGLLTRILPEWAGVRYKPQRNAYHRFTVDRHLWEAAANAADLADRVTRPDLLVLGALLHDIGKGYPGDHTDVGVDLVKVIGPRLGLSDDDVDVVLALVKHHLLLPDVATRRDLSDDGTIQSVASAAGSDTTLGLLHALTEADSLATGVSAWGSWKSELVALLVDRTRHVLGGGDPSDVTWRLFPTTEVLELMGEGNTAIRTTEDRVTVVAPDRPGLFSRVAGVLSLHGLDVISAEAHSDDAVAGRQAMAANEFRLVPPADGISWTRIVADLERALAGQLAIEARLAERANTYRRRKQLSATVNAPSVRIHNDASSNATVVEVRAPDRIGILHRIAKSLGELGLDIRHAKIQTMGNDVVDSFYVRTAERQKVTDTFHLREIERAILFAVSQ